MTIGDLFSLDHHPKCASKTMLKIKEEQQDQPVHYYKFGHTTHIYSWCALIRQPCYQNHCTYYYLVSLMKTLSYQSFISKMLIFLFVLKVRVEAIILQKALSALIDFFHFFSFHTSMIESPIFFSSLLQSYCYDHCSNQDWDFKTWPMCCLFFI